MFEDLFGTSPKPTVKKTGKIFGDLFATGTPTPAIPKVVQPNIPTVKKLSPSIGGGAFISYPGRSQELVPQPRDVSEGAKNIVRGGSFADTNAEVDHVISLALGGANVESNLQSLKDKKTISQTVVDALTGRKSLPKHYTPANRQEGKMLVEWQAIDDYKKGKLTLNEARAKVLQKQQELQGLSPTPEQQTTLGQLPSAVKELPAKVGSMFGDLFNKAKEKVIPAAGATENVYKPFKATFYNPIDPKQTKANPDGKGAFNKPVQFGDIAMGNRAYKQGDLIFVKELADVQTPNGAGIFRVNDKKNIRYNNGTDSFDFAIPDTLPNAKELKQRIGNNQFNFQLIGQKPQEKAQSISQTVTAPIFKNIFGEQRPPSVLETIKQLPSAGKETLQKFGFIPPTVNDQVPTFDKEDLSKLSPVERIIKKQEITGKVLKEVPNEVLKLGIDAAKSVLGTLVSPFTKKQEVNIPFTNTKIQTVGKFYNDTKQQLGTIPAILLTTSKIAGDALIIYGGLRTVGKIPVEKPTITKLTKTDIRDITIGDELLKQQGKTPVSPAKKAAFNQLSQEGVNFSQLLKKTGEINIKTGKAKTLNEALAEWYLQNKGKAGLSMQEVTPGSTGIEPVRGPEIIKPTEVAAGVLPGVVQSPIEKLNSFRAKLREGAVTPAEVKQTYQEFTSSIDQVKQELSTKTKADLSKMVYARPGDTKQDLVDQIAKGMVGTFSLGKTITYSPFSKETYEGKVAESRKGTNLKVTKTSNNLYHTTSAENLNSIIKNGLTTGNKARFEGVSSPNKISFGANEETASYYGKTGDIMLRTKTGFKPNNLEEDLLAGGKGAYTTDQNISPENLEIKQNKKWVPLSEVKQPEPIKPPMDDFEAFLEQSMADQKKLYTPAADKKLTEIEQYQKDVLKQIDSELLNSGAYSFQGQQDMNYDRFVNFVKDPRLLNPKYKEIIQSGDVQSFKDLVKKLNIFDNKKEDLFRSDTINDNDLFNLFRQRLLKENPNLLGYTGKPSPVTRVKTAIGRQKRIVDMKKFAERMVKRATIKEIPTKELVKPLPVKKITRPETTLLRDRLKMQEFGARKGKIAGREQVLNKIREEKDQREFLASIQEGILKGFEKERNSVRKQIGFERHTKKLDGSVLARAKSVAGIEEWKNATKTQLDRVLEIVKSLKEGDKFLTENQYNALGDYVKVFSKPKELVTVREIQDVFKEQDEIMNGVVTRYISNTLIPTVDVKEGHEVISKVVDNADLQLRIAHKNIKSVNEKLDRLLSEAEKSRKQGLFKTETQKRIFQWLSGDTIGAGLTPKELVVAQYLKDYFKTVRTELELERSRRNYIPHIPKTFWEKFVENKFNLTNTIKSYRTTPESDLPMSILLNLDQIVGSEKFFKFGMERKGGVDPTFNLRRILHEYSSLVENKKALDQILPEGQAAMNLLLQPKSAIWMKQYLQNLKGRGLDANFRNGKAGWILKGADKIVGFNYVRLLGGNLVSGIKNLVAGESSSFIYQPVMTYLTGKKRFFTAPKKAYRIINDTGLLEGSYVELVKQNFVSTGKQVLNWTLYGTMEAGEYEMRGSFFLGELTPEEWRTEKVTPERVREIMNKIAITQGVYSRIDSPLFVQTGIGRALMQFGRWKITNSLLVRRIVDGTYKEFKQGNFNGPNMHRAMKMFAVYALGSYLAYELGKRGNKVAQKVAKASTELFGTLVNLIPEILKSGTGQNPAQQTLAALLYSYQELAGYTGLAKAPSNVTMNNGIEDMYVSAFNLYKSTTPEGKFASDVSKAKTVRAEEIKSMKSVYEKVQRLKSSGEIEKAQAIIDKLTDAEYTTYKKVASTEKSKITKEGEIRLYPIVKQVQKLKAENKIEEAQKIVEGLSDSDYKLYQLAKKKLGY